MRLKDRPVFSVQYHPEASPGAAGQRLPVRAIHRGDGGALRLRPKKDAALQRLAIGRALIDHDRWY
jgi:hypothetical protein